MVRKMTDNGGEYHEPPYTEEEEAEFYRRFGGGPVSLHAYEGAFDHF